MVAFGVIGFLVLLLIYMALHSQALQKELKQTQRELKSTGNQGRFSLNTVMMLCGQLQNNYQARLDKQKKHALINEDDYGIAYFIISNLEFVVMQCCEHRTTVEEAVNKALASSSDYKMEQINQFIAKYPSEVRLPWCKNTVSGFISACHKLTSAIPGSKAKSTEEAEEA